VEVDAPLIDNFVLRSAYIVLRKEAELKDATTKIWC
jgi:hypothetical protein